MANKKKAVSRAAIGELIRKHKGKNAVESENIGGCKNPKYHRYQFVGLSGGVLHLDLENLTEHMMPADSKTAKKWHVRRETMLKYTQSPGLPGSGLGCFCNCVESPVAIRPKNQAPAIRCTGS